MNLGGSDPFGLLGQVLDGQFRIDEVAGEGGSSVVYRGEHVGFDSKVAIKCLKLQAQLESSQIEAFMRRFREEGRAAYKLAQGHFHIARCIAIGTTLSPKTGSLVPYTVLEWLEGKTLARQFEERRLAGGQGRPLGDLLPLLDTAVDAVAYAHTQGVVHRDLHPGSIFLAESLEGVKAKVLDFGLAKVASEQALGSASHVDGAAANGANAASFRVFSPAYATPEQLDATIGSVGPPSDVYALAMVLLEAMRDQPPFLGLSLSELRTRILDPRARPTPRDFGVMVSDDVQDVFARALAREPGERFLDAADFWSALKSAVQNGASDASLADATQRMDALPDSDSLLSLVGYDDGPTLNDVPPVAPRAAGVRPVIDEETTIDDGIPVVLPRQPAAPEISGVQSSAQAESAAADVTGPRAKTPSADFTGPHVAMSTADATAPRKALSGQGGKADAPTRGPVVLGVLLGAGAALVALSVLASFYLQRLQRSDDVVVAASGPPHPSPPPAGEGAQRLPSATVGATTGVAPMATADPAPSRLDPAPPGLGSASARPKGRTPPLKGAVGPTPKPVAEEPTEIPPPADPSAFNRPAAEASLRVLDGILASCRRPDGKGGEGSARVTFTNDGTVSGVKITGPLADGPEGDCVALRYRNAKIPPFEGPPAFVEHAFRLPK
ncbi:protein kinase [Pendulispora rubella]|uniref:Protein kinase n=1 Tax=Pendulispora rubella TaxID=2741070 RepID=A0ABZ2LAL1_9BACT